METATAPTQHSCGCPPVTLQVPLLPSGCLVRSLHSLISELIQTQTHRQQWMLSAAISVSIWWSCLGPPQLLALLFHTGSLRCVSGISLTNSWGSCIGINNIDTRAGRFLKVEKLRFRGEKGLLEKLTGNPVTTQAVLAYWYECFSREISTGYVWFK